MKWLNEAKGVLSAGEQLEPVLDDQGNFINGHLENGEFKPDEKGPDILHRPVPGQIQVADDDPRVIAFKNRKVKTIEQRVEEQMNSPAVIAVRAGMNTNGAADERIRQALRAKIEADNATMTVSRSQS
jgi:hypothetical protein